MAINCTELVDLLQRYYLPTMYSLEFSLGFLGNLLVILGYLLSLKEWKSTNIYLFSLAVSDLVFLCTLPRLAYTYSCSEPESSPFLCIANRYILHVNMYSSIMFMMWVSVNRYLVVRYPFRQHPLRRKGAAMAVTGLIFVVANVLVVPLIVYIVQDMDRDGWSQCSDFGSLTAHYSNELLTYSLSLTAVGYILPLIVLCLLSVRIVVVLRAQEGVFQNRADPSPFRHPQRIVLASAIMFLVLYSPYHVMRNMSISQRAMPHHACIMGAYIITRPIAFAHSVINPAFFFFMGDNFKELLIEKVSLLFHRRYTQTSLPIDGDSTAPPKAV